MTPKMSRLFQKRSRLDRSDKSDKSDKSDGQIGQIGRIAVFDPIWGVFGVFYRFKGVFPGLLGALLLRPVWGPVVTFSHRGDVQPQNMADIRRFFVLICHDHSTMHQIRARPSPHHTRPRCRGCNAGAPHARMRPSRAMVAPSPPNASSCRCGLRAPPIDRVIAGAGCIVPPHAPRPVPRAPLSCPAPRIGAPLASVRPVPAPLSCPAPCPAPLLSVRACARAPSPPLA